jgi:NAD(P)-dependent dehydrogenase (short-subunit alcohol dehydrogenase family)
MDVNVRAPFELSKRVLPHLEKRGGGSIIHISSIGGISPEPMLGVYSVSKAALLSLTKVMAKEWGHSGVRVNAICPGLVKTKFSRAIWENDDIAREVVSSQPIARMAEPDEIAPLALFLASPASAYVTGAIHTVDGGHTI